MTRGDLRRVLLDGLKLQDRTQAAQAILSVVTILGHDAFYAELNKLQLTQSQREAIDWALVAESGSHSEFDIPVFRSEDYVQETLSATSSPLRRRQAPR